MPAHTHAQEETSHCRLGRFSLSRLTLLVGCFSTSLTCSLAANYFCNSSSFKPPPSWFPFSLFIPSAAVSCSLNNLPEAMSATPYSASLALFCTPTLLYPHSQHYHCSTGPSCIPVLSFCLVHSHFFCSLAAAGRYTLNTSHQPVKFQCPHIPDALA